MDYQRNSMRRIKPVGRSIPTNTAMTDRPLAMVYPEKQVWEEPYSMTDALYIGTVFPSLDMPFLAANGRRQTR